LKEEGEKAETVAERVAKLKRENFMIG